MNRFYAYLNAAALLIKSYDGSVPLRQHLKEYFSSYKKHGSKDRKLISHLCYCYFRPGHSLPPVTIEERIKIALFLCSDHPGEWNVVFEPDWLSAWNIDLAVRIIFIKRIFPAFQEARVFPWNAELTNAVDAEAFGLSHLRQPRLFLRLRPGHAHQVARKLQEAGILFEACRPDGIALSNATSADAILQINKEAVVQDLSSQRTGDLFLRMPSDEGKKIKIWDCCAASGGKSIMAYDRLGEIELYVSDNRPVILRNLRERLKEAGITGYHSFTADLTDPLYKPSPAYYDLIIADVPCSGSGTWGRTPEQLYFFKEEKIRYYVSLQQRIVSKAITALKPGGTLIYITCSVFRKENEEIVNFITTNFRVKLEKMEFFAGYPDKADSMFAARFIAV